jgi:hypothetical protein
MRTTTSATGGKRSGYAAVRPPTVLRTWLHDKARLERPWLKEGAVTIPNADPLTKHIRRDLEDRRVTRSGTCPCRPTSTPGAFLLKGVRRGAINLAVSQRTMGRRATTDRETGPHPMGHSQAGPRSMSTVRTIALSIRMPRAIRHPRGKAPEADVLMRRASVMGGGPSR